MTARPVVADVGGGVMSVVREAGGGRYAIRNSGYRIQNSPLYFELDESGQSAPRLRQCGEAPPHSGFDVRPDVHTPRRRTLIIHPDEQHCRQD